MEFQIYKDRSNLWRWRLLASNNKIIADGSEGYISKQNAIDAVNRIKLNAFVATITYLNF